MRYLPLFFLLICTSLSAQETSYGWELNHQVSINGAWELQDTVELEVYSRHEVWDECMKYVKEVPTITEGAPNDLLYYQTKTNKKTGEFYARTVRYTWRKRELPTMWEEGSVKLRIRNVEDRSN